ncbi:MAG TPA: outer membrane beta-barrel protein [Pyrinomonadaceae bacterium]|nr:outer membrane beta-barrel protein [Pyrinomonadaceae bacterium]
MITVCASPAFSQNNGGADQTPKLEYFVGYSVSGYFDEGEPVVVNNQSFSPFFNDQAGGPTGFEASVIGNLNRYVGLKGDFSFYANNRRLKGGTFTSCVGTACTSSIQDYRVDSRAAYLMGGPEIKGRNRTRFTPFVHALFGLVHSRTEFSTSGTFNISDQASENAFTMAFGGGLDIRASKRISIRAMMDYNPTFFKGSEIDSRDRQDHVRLSLGILFH